MSSAQNTGQYQSPIEIRQVAGSASVSVVLNYVPTSLHMLNTGHTVQVNPQVESYLTIDNRRYDLKQFHFHAPSEHLVKGEQYDMEVHLVHEGSRGELAVVGVLYQRGDESDFIRSLWEHIPPEPGGEYLAKGATIRPSVMIPPAGKFYTYDGSLTTPPYTEGVLWFLFQESYPVSPAQIDKFSALFGQNARAVQPLHGRMVLEGRLPAE